MARPAARALPLAFLVAFAAAFLAAAAFAGQAVAQGATNNSTSGGGPAADYVVTIHEAKTPAGALAWDVTSMQLPAKSTFIGVYDAAGATAPHNIAFTVAGKTITTGAPTDAGKHASAVITVPDSGTITYVCQVHSEMTGKITVGAFGGGAGAGGESHITSSGVHFLAHWVGVIAFAALFILYGLSFFLFKYNETPFTTDQKDRAVPASASSRESYGEPHYTSRSNVVIVGLLLAVIALVLVLLAKYGVLGKLMG